MMARFARWVEIGIVSVKIPQTCTRVQAEFGLPAGHGVSCDEPRLRLADTAWQWPEAVAASEAGNE